MEKMRYATLSYTREDCERAWSNLPPMGVGMLRQLWSMTERWCHLVEWGEIITVREWCGRMTRTAQGLSREAVIEFCEEMAAHYAEGPRHGKEPWA